MKSIKLHISLVEKVISDKDITLFSKWISFKYMHRNSRLYNYNPNKAAVEYKRIYKQNISPKTVASNVKKFIDKSWCTIDKKGHLVFLRQSDIVELYGLDNLGTFELMFTSKRKINYKSVRLSIYKEIFDRKKSQQDLLLEVKSDTTKKPRLIKKAIKVFGEELVEKTMDSTDKVVNISYAGLGNVFGTSQSGAYYIMKEILQRSSLRKIKRSSKVSRGKFASGLNRSDLKGHFYNGNEFTFVTYPNQYTYE